MKLSAAREGFLLSKLADGMSQNTADMYRWALDLLIKKIGDVDVRSITSTDLKVFWIWLRVDYEPNRTNGDKRPLSGRSLENVWTAHRSFFKWALLDGVIDRRPDEKIERPRYTNKEVEPITQDEFRRVFAACERTKQANTNRRAQYTSRRKTAVRDQAILLILLDTGLRVSELSRLNIGDVNLQDGEIVVAPYGSGRKTKARRVYISKATVRALWRYIMVEREGAHDTDPLIITTRNKRMDRNAIRQLLIDLGRKAGVRGNLHPHRMRHTAALEYVKNGGDPFSMQSLFGWVDMEMPRRYITMSGRDLREAHAKASPVDGLGPLK